MGMNAGARSAAGTKLAGRRQQVLPKGQSSMWQRLAHLEGGFEDLEGLLTTEMLVAAIVLSIVVGLHVMSFGHDTMVAGDLRHAYFDIARGKKLEEDSYMRFISGRIFVDGYVAISCSSYSLLTSAAIYIALVFLGARSDEVLFRRWWRMGRVLVLMSFIPLLIAIIFFLRLNHDSVYMVYPKYNWNSVLSPTEGAPLAVLNFTENLVAADSLNQTRYNATNTSLLPRNLGQWDASRTVGEERSYGHDIAEMSRNIKLGMHAALSVTAVLIIMTQLWSQCCKEKPTSSLTRVVEPEAYLNRASTVTCLAKHIQLLQERNQILRQCMMNQQLPLDKLVSEQCPDV